MERKEAIKFLANLAMASARNGSTIWSRTIIFNDAKDLGSKERPVQPTTKSRDKQETRPTKKTPSYRKAVLLCAQRRKKMMVRNHQKRKCIGQSRKYGASTAAERLVKKRTLVLKQLVPGGDYIDESVLIKEALDYMFALRAQVQVMQTLVNVQDVGRS